MTGLQTNLITILNEKETKIIPENIKKDVIVLGVTGAYEGSGGGTVEGVKQFSTIGEMQADTTAKEGDLAIVYRSGMQNANEDSQFRTATFPDTVVLDTVMTDFVNLTYIAVDSSKIFNCWGVLDSSSFMMECNTETGSIRIEYTSSDGITYTRTDTIGNPVDFGTEIYYKDEERWNDAIGKFIQIRGSTFEGLFRYSNSSWLLAPTQLTTIADYVHKKEFYGKNGIEKGTLQNKENLTKDEVVRRVDMWTNYSTGIVCSENMADAFSYKSYAAIPELDTSNVTDMQGMFNTRSNLTAIPELNTSNVTNMSSMFANCTSLTTIPGLNTRNVTNMNSMFNNCTSLTTIPVLFADNVTDMSYMFNNCTSLATMPLLATGDVTDMSYMFSGCVSLTNIPYLSASRVNNMSGMFDGCTNLTTIPSLDTRNVTDMQNMFQNCTNLTDESLNNILEMCANATHYTQTKTLEYIGLTSEQATRCATLSNYQTFLDAGWTTGY